MGGGPLVPGLGGGPLVPGQDGGSLSPRSGGGAYPVSGLRPPVNRQTENIRVFPKVDHSANVARIVLVDKLLD